MNSSAFAESLLSRRPSGTAAAPRHEPQRLDPVSESAKHAMDWLEPDWLDAPDLPAFPSEALPEPFASFVAA